MLVFPLYCHKVGTCSLSTFKDYLYNGASEFWTNTLKLVLKLDLSCLNMADERQIMVLLNTTMADIYEVPPFLPLKKSQKALAQNNQMGKR